MALVSGLPSRERYGRLILMLQGYFDGSTEAGEALIVAGYIADTATWLPFSDQWQAKLDLNDGGRPFKMSRAAKTAKGMRRARAHYEMIEASGLVGIGCAVPIKPLAKIVAELGITPKMSNPYYVAWRLLITSAVQFLRSRGINEKIQFCFDIQTEQVNVLKAWEIFHASCPPQYRKYISKTITFADDEEVRPLQAADLLAWFSREQYVKEASRMGEMFPTDWLSGEPVLFFTEMKEDGLRKLLEAEVASIAKRGRTIASLQFSTSRERYPSWGRR